VPALYAAPDSLLQRLNLFAKNGGHILYTFKCGFANENGKVRTSKQPGIIGEACGIEYSQFTIPVNVSLKDDPFHVGKENNTVQKWMELINPTTAIVLAQYDHAVWGKYAAITQNKYGKGLVTYMGCMTSDTITEKIIENVVKAAGLWSVDQEIRFPLIVKSGVNQLGKIIHYYFNYSDKPASFIYRHNNGEELLTGTGVAHDKSLEIAAWGVKIIEEG
jgi:beta-galactosidase